MDIKLNFIEKGTGFPLILLHGNGEDLSYFQHQTEYFSKYYKVIALDTRGHGMSKRGTAPFTISQFAEDLHDFMTEKKIEKANILGFSDGGNIALKFVLKYPECVEKLVLNGANLNPKGVKFGVQIPIEIGYRIASLFAKHSEKAKQNAEMLGLMVNDPYIEAERLLSIKSKTLVIAGINDMIKEEHTKLISKYIPGSKLVFLKGNHFIASHNPFVFNKTVKEFLDE